MEIIKQILSLFLVVLLLSTAVSAAIPEIPFEGRSLQQVMEDFMAENQLNESNFSMSYYNTVTGEHYSFNDETFMLSASTYKLPLNMYFYEMEQRGEISGDTVLTWTNQTMETVHEQSIVYSNNELSEAMIYYWNDFVTYKENMRTYFTMTDEEIPPIYYDDSRGNFFCVRMMMDCLQYLYGNRDSFRELLAYMKEACPGEYFKGLVDEYEVAHKYGYLTYIQNDVGIIYTPQPILLAVYTTGIYGESICAETARLLTDYTVWQAEQAAPEAPAEEPAPAEPAEEPEPVPAPAEPAEEPEPVPAPAEPVEEPEAHHAWLILPAACAVGLLILIHHRRQRHTAE